MKSIKLTDGKIMYLPDGWGFYNAGEVQPGDMLIGFRKLPDPNPMPELEVGDWYTHKCITCICRWDEHRIDKERLNDGGILEIRKPNGQVWKREG